MKGFAAATAALGWTTGEIWGIHRVAPIERLDAAGLVRSLNGRELVAADKDKATIRTRSGKVLILPPRQGRPERATADLGGRGMMDEQLERATPDQHDARSPACATQGSGLRLILGIDHGLDGDPGSFEASRSSRMQGLLFPGEAIRRRPRHQQGCRGGSEFPHKPGLSLQPRS